VLAVQHAVAELTGIRFDEDDADPPEDDGVGRTVWVDVHTGLGAYGRYSVLTKGNENNDDEHAGGGGGDRSCTAWMAELVSLLEGAGMGYRGSTDPGVFSG
jgi:hypothetical protein